jgi:hypothetical protein
MDSGNMSEVDNKVTQPEEAVAAEAEVNLEEQHSSEEETELFIEEEAEQTEAAKKEGMTEAQARAAQKEDRAKWKKKNAENIKLTADKVASDARETELRDRIAKLEAASKGNKPSILDYSTDEEYLADVEKWNGAKPEAKPAASAANNSDLSEDQAYHLHKNEEEIKKSFKDYDDVKSLAVKAWATVVSDTDTAMKQIAAVCHENDIHTGKVNYAIGRFPEYADKLLKASNTNQSAVRTVLRELEGKIQSRTRKKVDSEPEPKFKSNGAVNVGSESEKAAYKKWSESGSVTDYKALQKIRKANKPN